MAPCNDADADHQQDGVQACLQDYGIFRSSSLSALPRGRRCIISDYQYVQQSNQSRRAILLSAKDTLETNDMAVNGATDVKFEACIGCANYMIQLMILSSWCVRVI